jgi:hypothetical protein
MRKLFTIATFCAVLGFATPCRAALIDIGSISLVDFGNGAEIVLQNLSAGLLFEGAPIEDAFTNIVLSVAGQDYVWGRTDGLPDFYSPALEGLVREQISPTADARFLTFDPSLFLVEATVAFSFGGRLVEGGGALAMFDTPTSLFVDIPDGAAPVPEPGTLLLLSAGLTLGAGRHIRRRRSSAS